MTQGGFGPPSDPYGGGAPFAGDPFAVPGTPSPAPSPPTGPTGSPPPPRLRGNTLATLSIVFAFVFAPAGVVLGHLGLTQARRSGGMGRDRALIGLTLSYLVTTVAVVALVVWAVTGNSATTPTIASPTVTATPGTAAPTPTTTAPPPPPTVDAAGMAGLLLSPDEVKTLMGDPTMEADKSYDTIEFPTPDQGTIEPADCMGSFVAGTPPPYQGSNWRKFLQTTLLNKQTGLQATQSVTQFDDAAAAQKALAGYVDSWRRCANTQLTLTVPGGASMQITLAAPVDTGGGITTLTNTVAGSPGAYTRAIAAKNNVLIDNQVSGPSLTDQIVTLTKRILARIPG